MDFTWQLGQRKKFCASIVQYGEYKNICVLYIQTSKYNDFQIFHAKIGKFWESKYTESDLSFDLWI